MEKPKLHIKISSYYYNGGWMLIDILEPNNYIRYKIGTSLGNDDVKNRDQILSVESGEAYNSMVSKTLYFELLDKIRRRLEAGFPRYGAYGVVGGDQLLFCHFYAISDEILAEGPAGVLADHLT